MEVASAHHKAIAASAASNQPPRAFILLTNNSKLAPPASTPKLPEDPRRLPRQGSSSPLPPSSATAARGRRAGGAGGEGRLFKVVDPRPGAALVEIVLHEGRNRVASGGCSTGWGARRDPAGPHPGRAHQARRPAARPGPRDQRPGARVAAVHRRDVAGPVRPRPALSTCRTAPSGPWTRRLPWRHDGACGPRCHAGGQRRA